MNRNRIQFIAAIVVVLGLLGVAVNAQEKAPVEQAAIEETAVAVVVSPLLQYQGRLTDPATGEPVVDGTYEMGFRLYTQATGTTALWKESKDIPVQGGLFSTALGDTTPLDQGLFNGQALWLGMKVGTDKEATPRQQVLPVAYALGLVPGAAIKAKSNSAALSVSNSGSGEALHAGGPVVVKGDLTVDGSLSGGSHNHPNYVTSYEFDDHVYGGLHHDRYTDADAISAVQSWLPIASGVINGDGSVASGTSNVTSKWNAGWKAYEITIDGHDYDWQSYVTVVTPVSGGIANAWSNDGKLQVGIYDSDGLVIKLPFQFVTFIP